MTFGDHTRQYELCFRISNTEKERYKQREDGDPMPDAYNWFTLSVAEDEAFDTLLSLSMDVDFDNGSTWYHTLN